MSELKTFMHDCDCSRREAKKWFTHVQRMEKEIRHKGKLEDLLDKDLPDEGEPNAD